MTQTLARLDARALRVLVREMCDLCNDANDVRKFLNDAEVPSATVHFDDRILILWTSALREAQHHRRTPALLERVHKEYLDAPAVTAALDHPWDASVDEALEELLTAVRMGPAAYGLIRSIAQPLPSNPPPSAYLKAQHGVIGFTGREARLEELLAWCQTPEPFAVRVLTGAGGMGKTRLLMQVCEQIKEHHDWIAGFIGREDSKTALQAQMNDLWTGVTHQDRPTLIVMDYAESRLEQVRGLLQAAFERHTGPHPLRLILVARDEGGWWTQLCEDFPRLNTAKFETLESLTDSDTTRLLEYERALGQFNTLTRPGEPAPPDTPDLSEPHFARVLMVHAAALMRLHGFRPAHDPDGTQLLEELLKRERRYWGMQLEAKAFTALEDAKTVLQHAMTLVTLGFFVGTDEPEPLADLLALLPKAAGFDGDKRLTLARILHEAYPSPNAFVDGLQPDVFSEHVVHASLTGSAGQVLIELAFDHEHANPEVALTVLARLASRRPTVGEPLLERILQDRLEGLAEVVVSVVLAGGVGLLGVIEGLVRNGSTHNVAENVINAIPWQTQVFANLALICNEILIKHFRSLNHRSFLALRLIDYSYRLNSLGRVGQALKAIQEAVDIYRELASALPNEFNCDFALSLNNLGNCLRENGQLEQALLATHEAVKIKRLLPKDQMDKFNQNLSSSLNNLSAFLNDLGHHRQAFIFAKEALSLNCAQGHSEKLKLHLTGNLTNLGIILGALGRRKLALKMSQEAVQISRSLVGDQADAYTPNLALSLNNLSVRLSELGQQQQALQAIQEAVEIRRELAQGPLDASEDLAISLNILSKLLGESGDPNGALHAAIEAVQFMRPYFLRDPQTYKSQMESILKNYHQCSQAAGVKLDLDLLEPLMPCFFQPDSNES